mmetsp:Transcript_13431/g.1970  ORF Transcript_13431/g.1970 Transcript_13431/m.1970 type:complete len:92 (+) Transcript_13431:181-456(+)
MDTNIEELFTFIENKIKNYDDTQINLEDYIFTRKNEQKYLSISEELSDFWSNIVSEQYFKKPTEKSDKKEDSKKEDKKEKIKEEKKEKKEE